MSRGQSLIEFSLVIGLLLLLIVATAQVAVVLHYRSTLQVAAQEGAFEGSLAGHGAEDARTTSAALWLKLEPGAAPAHITVSVENDLVVVTAQADAPALLPLPMPPFTRVPVRVRAVHSIERFRPGSQP
jgi:TadE-like protein